MEITWAHIAWGIGLFLGWNGFLVGIIRFFIAREIKGFEAKLDAAEKRASDAAKTASEAKAAISSAVSDLRVEVSKRDTCSQHGRMEDNDRELFQTLRTLHGDIGTLVGEIKGLRNSMDLVNQHLLNGGK